MAVSAFKTKYTGEQIEELFDKLKDLGPAIDITKTFTTEYPYIGASNIYETDNIKISASGCNANGWTGCNLHQMLMCGNAEMMLYQYGHSSKPAYIQFDFKTSTIVPEILYLTTNSNTTAYFDVYYLIDGEYQIVKSLDINTGIGEHNIELPNIQTTSVKIIHKKNSSYTNAYIKYFYLNFKLLDTDAIVKNSNANPSIQNNFATIE